MISESFRPYALTLGRWIVALDVAVCYLIWQEYGFRRQRACAPPRVG
jgi:hypothetical protein